MVDSWCESLRLPNGRKISGGAARNRRIADAGGMDCIVEEVARDAATRALARANAAVETRVIITKLQKSSKNRNKIAAT
ncbi:hypothetical protein [Nitrosomonas sp. Nm33]|uniref:hypothetical protein n=1 Tax=Nitrosomonas sp. Nm33 TaxID=133724 RepID=UPI00089AE4C8|nr:hypothetical protein [Nitrosomonas sp. Nm33]SDY44083.1 hypothetical protein SAMN05421755_102235 [Nitrosomonas sp. Nm33]